MNGSYIGDGNDTADQILVAFPHEFGHAFDCRHSDAIIFKDPDNVFNADASTVIGTTDNGDPDAVTSGTRKNRFGTKCTLKMINGQFDLNVFNRIQGLNDDDGMGPSFGWKLDERLYSRQ